MQKKSKIYCSSLGGLILIILFTSKFCATNFNISESTLVTQIETTELPTLTPIRTVSSINISTPTVTLTPTLRLSSTPTPSITPTSTLRPQNPLPVFPINMGNTWVYSATHYEIDRATGQKITATYVITELIKKTGTYSSFFIAEVRRDILLIDGIAPKWNVARPSSKSYLYVIGGTYVYKQRGTLINPLGVKLLEYKFPLSKHTNCWYPNLSTEAQIEIFGDKKCPSWGYRYIGGSVFPNVPIEEFSSKDCTNIVEVNQGSTTNKWFCSGIGIVGGTMDYSGPLDGENPYPSGYGYDKILIAYKIVEQ